MNIKIRLFFTINIYNKLLKNKFILISCYDK